MTEELPAFLRSTALFRHLSLEELGSFSGSLTKVSFAPGEVVFCEGRPAACSWLVLSGLARIVVDLSGSRQLEVERRGRGEIFGLFCRLGSVRDYYPCTATAEGPMEALRIPDAIFMDIIRKHPPVSQEACALCSDRLGAMRRLAARGRESARWRVGRLLLDLVQVHGKGVPATRRSLSQQAGTTVETAFRVLSFFRRRGWISTSRGRVIVIDPAALAESLESGREPR